MKPNAVAIVPLVESLVVGEELFGYISERITVEESLQMEICFPQDVGKDRMDVTLECPYTGIQFIDEELCWGGVHLVSDDRAPLNYRISALLIKLYGVIEHNIQPSVTKVVSTFLKVLEFRKPNAICENLNSHRRGTSDEFPISTWESESGDFIECGVIQLSDIFATDVFNKEDVEYAVSNSKTEISLPYQMLHVARRCYYKRDYRGCILSCGSALEIPFQQMIIHYLVEHSVPEKLRKHILAKLQGIHQKAEMCKKLGLPITFKKEYIAVTKKRNEVIHYGRSLTAKDVKPLLDLTFKFMQEQNVSLFE